jgi:hypothetical protein
MLYSFMEWPLLSYLFIYPSPPVLGHQEE